MTNLFAPTLSALRLEFDVDMKEIAVLILVVVLVRANVYLHNPRGSNGRLNEANANRNNANRLFDSQNNGMSFNKLH